MADPFSGYVGDLRPEDTASDFDTHSFIVESIINRLATTAIVKVKAVTNSGGVTPVGFVDVVVMVNQLDGAGNPTPHNTIHSLPYVRVQGGANAIILDPVVGDIGIAVFCSRDTSAVKRTKAIANPGSRRTYDWADGLYIGGVLNGVPTQYVRFSTSGIAIVSTSEISLQAPNIKINGTTTVTGDVSTTGALTNNSHSVGSTHVHTNSGGTGLGGPPV